MFNLRSTSRDLAQILDRFAEDNRLNVYAGKLEVRPPGAPTTRAVWNGRVEQAGRQSWSRGRQPEKEFGEQALASATASWTPPRLLLSGYCALPLDALTFSNQYSSPTRTIVASM